MSVKEIQSYIKIDKFRQLSGPLIDIRSPKEFTQGHWPGAINLPLFSDEQRAEVGKTYKKQGRKKAVLLGLKIAGSRIPLITKTLRGVEKKDFGSEAVQNQQIRLYCWRGGMRSASIGWVAQLFGLRAVILHGGYKQYRKWVLKQFETEWPLLLIGGRTGTGKTDLLIEMSNKGIPVIDLEGLANHRGSSFGFYSC